MREIAAVVDVCVGEHRHVDLRWIEGEIAIALKGLMPPPLIQTAVQQDALTVDLDEVLRTGGGASGTAEGEFHGGLGNGSPAARTRCFTVKLHGPCRTSRDIPAHQVEDCHFGSVR